MSFVHIITNGRENIPSFKFLIIPIKISCARIPDMQCNVLQGKKLGKLKMIKFVIDISFSL